jgi:hypothetical protein
MPDEPSWDFRAAKVPDCPYCGTPLFPYGARIKTWGLLEWVEAWHCAIHGAVIHVTKDEDQTEPEK